MKRLCFAILTCIFCLGIRICSGQPILVYTLCSQDDRCALYDEAVAVACMQGLYNRKGAEMYVLSELSPQPAYWLQLFLGAGYWLENRTTEHVADLDSLFERVRNQVAGAVIWDPTVPATLNVATTVAGVERGIVMSPEFAAQYLERWALPVLRDFRGMFTGAMTGSAKNDAYRWAIDNYLSKGLCDKHRLFICEDAYSTRQRGIVDYVVVRDWAVKNAAFVFDLSPWGDEVPQDDPAQPIGTDLATYKAILEENLKQTKGRIMTEISGFFAFSKYANTEDHPSSHDPVPTEWESVWLMSPYNCYQNTVAGNCYNQSFHSQAPNGRLRQQRPVPERPVEKKTYVCILMADYDSTTPLYEFLPKFWADSARGSMPFIWGINPNLSETYPDIIEHLYRTASDKDWFGADASAAGYMNPSRIRPEHLPLFIRHNRKFYRRLDMSWSPMVLDWKVPSEHVKEAFSRFSPDGLATIVYDFHTNRHIQENLGPEPHLYKGMPVLTLHNDTGGLPEPEECAELMSRCIPAEDGGRTSFHMFRIVWTTPSEVIESIKRLKRLRPDLAVEVVDPCTFTSLFRKYYGQK